MSRVYVGGLTAETQKQELEDTFSKFGRLETVWVARQPPGFAFITFADAKDAEDACRAENANPKGWRVEISSGGRGGGGRGRGGGGRDGGPSQGRYDGAPPGRDDRGRDDYGRGRDSGRDYSRRSPSPRRRSRSPERRRSSPERRRSRSGDRERRRSRSGERRRSRDRR